MSKKKTTPTKKAAPKAADKPAPRDETPVKVRITNTTTAKGFVLAAGHTQSFPRYFADQLVALGKAEIIGL